MKIGRMTYPKYPDVPEGVKLLAIILDRTNFYAASGGQVGDKGTLTSASGVVFRVVDTQKYAGVVLHIGYYESTPVSP